MALAQHVVNLTMSKVSVSISVDSKTAFQIEQTAEKEGKTRTEKIVEILEEWMQKRK